MSKFLAIFIAAALIFSLFLTVNSIGDKYITDDPDVTSTTPTDVTTAKATSVTPSHGIRGDIYMHETVPLYGFTLIDNVAFFFMKLDYDFVDYKPSQIEIVARPSDGFVPNIRVSDDGLLWTLPETYGLQDWWFLHETDLWSGYESIYVSYCMFEVESVKEARDILDTLVSGPFTDSDVFWVYFDPYVGDPSLSEPSGGEK